MLGVSNKDPHDLPSCNSLSHAPHAYRDSESGKNAMYKQFKASATSQEKIMKARPA